MSVQLYKPALITLGGAKLSDHSRSPLSVSYEIINNKHRTVNGTLRNFHTATKRTFSCSWDLLPHTSVKTVDGGLGAADLNNFYFLNQGKVLDLILTYGYQTGQGAWSSDTIKVVISDFSLEIAKRGGAHDLYNTSISMEEV